MYFSKSNAFSLIILAIIFISGTIDLGRLFNYAEQPVPDYIDRDNTPNFNRIDNETATLGRVLFYDKRLSANNTISCGTCHIQAFAFSDTAQLRVGLDGGLTGRHAMRIVNSRFAQERRFFWDERAQSLEEQSTMPIQDHVEMGFSGTDGQPDFNDLIDKLSDIPEYQTLFDFAFGDDNITEDRIQLALGQFMRSIQSFDSRFDQGLAMTNGNVNMGFPNFSDQENRGKALYLSPPGGGPTGGAGCNGCHRAPEFDIDPASGNNGVVGVVGNPDATDLIVTRAPNLRDLVNPQGQLNGPMMHTGGFNSLRMVIDHYNDVPLNPQIDPRLRGGPNGQGQNLNLSERQKNDLEAFLRTLTGSNIYENPMYSDPFEPDGTLTLLPLATSTSERFKLEDIQVYPNPAIDQITVTGLDHKPYFLQIFDLSGRLIIGQQAYPDHPIDVSRLTSGMHVISVYANDQQLIGRSRFLKR